MTVWVFDRSGCYSPGPFNIHKEPERFVQVLAGHIMMNTDEFGLDMFTELDGDRRFVHVEHERTEMKLQLEHDSIDHPGLHRSLSVLLKSFYWKAVHK